MIVSHTIKIPLASIDNGKDNHLVIESEKKDMKKILMNLCRATLSE